MQYAICTEHAQDMKLCDYFAEGSTRTVRWSITFWCPPTTIPARINLCLLSDKYPMFRAAIGISLVRWISELYKVVAEGTIRAIRKGWDKRVKPGAGSHLNNPAFGQDVALSPLLPKAKELSEGLGQSRPNLNNISSSK